MKSSIYFKRYAYPHRFIQEPVRAETFVIAVIPAYKEENVLPTLTALRNCASTKYPVEVIWVVNHPEDASDSIKNESVNTVEAIEKFVDENPSDLDIHIIKAFDLAPKKAGVGLARKIGMDEAAFRLNSINQDGVILCFDADSSCESNYLEQVEEHFLTNPNCTGASIHFEHPTSFSNGDLNEAIVLYELHLRYYIQALKYVGYPYAFHTIGSSMAVRNSVYQKQGGMNQRKAGEDFYFLHKIIPLGEFHTISATTVVPSPRLSDRVPFGTGRAMQEHQNQTKDLTLSYDFEVFLVIKRFLKLIHKEGLSHQMPNEIREFIIDENLQSELNKIISQSKNDKHLKLRFFDWFNGFKMLKLVHYLRDNYYPPKKLKEQSLILLAARGEKTNNNITNIELLETYRKLDLQD